MNAGYRGALFDDAKSWLEKQPGMNPWPKGCEMLCEWLNAWAGEYGRAIFRKDPRSDAVAREACMRRLWTCWAHHWQQAAGAAKDGRADGRLVADAICAGRGYTGRGQLGGNPLEDVILAEAVQRGEPDAIERFQQQYKAFAIAQGIKANPRVAEDSEDWWYRLLDKLGGYSKPPGKLSLFHGRCGLRNWLGTVAKNFARQQSSKAAGTDSLADQPDRCESPDDDLAAGECLQLLAAAVQAALMRVPDKDRALLFLLCVEQLAGTEVAGIFQVHAGRISHRKDQMVTHVKEAMLACADEFTSRQAYEDCLELFTGHRNWRRLADILHETLVQIGPEAVKQVRRKEGES